MSEKLSNGERGKRMKKQRLSFKISAVIIVLLIVCMTILTILVSTSASKSMEQSAKNRMLEGAQARSAVIDSYMFAASSYIRGYVSAPAIVEFAADQSNPQKKAAAQQYTTEYSKSFQGVENIFVASLDDFTVLTASKEAAIGTLAAGNDEQLNATKVGIAEMEKTKDVYFRSIKVSPTTGELVIVLYAPIYDSNGKMTAYSTLALSASNLMHVLQVLSFKDWENAKIEIIDASQKSFVYSTDESVIGQQIAPEAEGLINLVQTSEEGVSDFVEGGETRLSAYKFMKDYNLIVVVSDSNKEIYKDATALTRNISIVSVLIIIIIAVLTMVVVNFLVKDLTSSSAIVGEIAANLDFTKVDDLNRFTSRGDEVGEVSMATKKLADAVSAAIDLIQSKSAKVSDSAVELNRSAGDTMENSTNITRAVGEIANGAVSQANTIQDGVTAVAAILDSVGTLDKEVNEAGDQTDSMKISSNNMRKSFSDLSDAMEETKTALGSVSETMGSVSDFVAEVQGAVDAINAIARQTNLLSLNASIEAARAGDAGRGFAVVAEEIGGLSEESATSSKSIGEIMLRLEDKTKDAVSTVKSLEQVIEKQKDITHETEGTIGEVIEMIDIVEKAFKGIKQACGTIKEQCSHVNDTMSELSAISEENAASSEETSASMEQVNATVQSFNDLAGDLSGIADDLNMELSKFRTK